MATLTGRTLGGFLIEEELGRGAMGVVFKARQLSMDRHVALKFLPKRLAQDEKVVGRFLREARAAGQLSHPHIVGVHDAGVVEGLHFIAMEFVDGTTVHKRVKDKGPFTEAESLDLGGQVADALRYAHGRGILHRDIKPDNFLLDKSMRVRLADLGLARFQNKSNNAELTQDGEAMGTPHYMSPEQCRGTEVDSRSDLYSLGASMYVMASGETPYEATSAAAVMVKVLTEPPRALKKMAPHLSPGYVAIVEKLMAKEVSRRFSDAAQVVEAIEKCKAGIYKGATAGYARIATGPVTPVASPTKFKLILYGVGAGAAALVALALLQPPQDDKTLPGGATALITTDRKNDTTPVPVAPTAPVKTGTPKSEAAPQKTEAKVDLPTKSVLTEDVNVLDMKPEQQRAVRTLSTLKSELREKLQSNPDLVIERLELFVKQHPHPRIADIALPAIREAKEAKEKLEKNWAAAKDDAEADVVEGKKEKAFRTLRKFAETHENSLQSVEAYGMMRGLLSELRARAAKAAENGNYDKAIDMLDGPVSRMPSEISDALKKDLEHYQTEKEKALAFAKSDEKAFQALYGTAVLRVAEIETGGRRYNFDDTAKLITDGATRLHSEQYKRDAKSLAEVYKKAGSLWSQMQHAANEGKPVSLPALGKYPAGQLIAWSDKELTYKPSNASGLPPQPVPWRLITPDNLMGLHLALCPQPKDAPDPFGIGALAFCVNLKDVAVEFLQKVSEKDSVNKASADVALRLIKPAAAAPVSRDALARQIYNDVLTARKAKDMDTALKLQNKLIVEFAETEFVQQNLKQIAQSAPPGAGSEPETPKTDPKTKEPAKEPEAKKTEKGTTAPAVLADLKRLNWVDVKGEWTVDPKLKGIYNVTGGGQLSVPLVDGAVQARFQLEEEATIEIFTRYEPESALTKKIQNDAEEYDMTVGQGYGVRVKGDKLTVFGDPTRGQFEAGTTKAIKFGKMAIPLAIDTKTIQGAHHTVLVTTRGEHLEIMFDDKVVARSTDNLRPTGSIVILIEGNAKLDTPAALK